MSKKEDSGFALPSDGNQKNGSDRKKRRQIASSVSVDIPGIAETKPIAKMKASISKNTLSDIEIEPHLKAEMDSLDDVKTSTKMQSMSTSTLEEDDYDLQVNDIWEQLGEENIDLSYASVGYVMTSGRMILDNDLLVSLLINYGYQINVVLKFIDEFNEMGKEDDKIPLVVVSSHMDHIYSEVEKLPHLIEPSENKNKKNSKRDGGKRKSKRKDSDS